MSSVSEFAPVGRMEFEIVVMVQPHMKCSNALTLLTLPNRTKSSRKYSHIDRSCCERREAKFLVSLRLILTFKWPLITLSSVIKFASDSHQRRL